MAIVVPLQKRVATLVRVSTLEQAQEGRGGIPRQTAAIERVVNYEDLSVVARFEIVDTSGADVFFTPQMNEICTLVRQGRIGGIVASELDRLVRPTEFSELGKLAVFQEHKCVFYYEGGKHHLDKPQDYVMSLIRLATAASEKGVIKERTMRGKEALRQMGRWPSANHLLPRGIRYDRKTGVFSVDETAIWPILEAYRIMHEEGHTCVNEVAKRVGLKRTGLRNTLQNPIYKGILSFRTKRAGKLYERNDGRQAQRKTVLRAPEEQHERVVLNPAPVSAERWNRVQMLLHDSHRRWTEKRTHVSGVVFLLKGIGACGHCGHPLVGVAHKAKGGSKPKSYYYCWSNHQRARKPQDLPRCVASPARRVDLEETLLRFTAERLTDAKFLEHVVAQALEARKVRHDSSLPNETFDREKSRLEGKQKRLLSLHLEETINEREFLEARATINRELEALEKRQAINREVPVSDICKFVCGIVRGAYTFSRIQDEAQRKEFIDQMFSQVVFKDATLTGFKLRPQFLTAFNDSGSSTEFKPYSSDHSCPAGGSSDNPPKTVA